MTSLLRCISPCALRRPCLASTVMRWSAVCAPQRSSSTEVTIDDTTAWTSAMSQKYGPGTHALFRAVYKDLCDEMRREHSAKPPPPLPNDDAQNEADEYEDDEGAETGAVLSQPSSYTDRCPDASPTSTQSVVSAVGPRSGSTLDCTNVHSNPNAMHSTATIATTTTIITRCATAGAEMKGSNSHGSISFHVDPKAAPHRHMGPWSVYYRRESNVAVFQRDADARARRGRVVAYAPVVMSDPPRLNARLLFADWFALEALVERNGVIVHFSLAVTEANLIMRNVRVYDASAQAELMDCTQSAEWVRDRLFYDGPCLQHLELDFQNELYDLMQDHEVTLAWAHWAVRWVSYLEHRCFVRWSLGVLDELIPSESRGPELDFLLPEECAELDQKVEDWFETQH